MFIFYVIFERFLKYVYIYIYKERYIENRTKQQENTQVLTNISTTNFFDIVVICCKV